MLGDRPLAAAVQLAVQLLTLTAHTSDASRVALLTARVNVVWCDVL
jgi:hypothetical protein